ncbi:MAG TPA: PAS domain S-box protein, partial [Candidatus Acidoferrales bacterium]|nr:PAS domain S-box protein [Candidatus Acidoferrales bacterium]
MSSTAKPIAQQSVLPPTPVANLTRGLLWKSLAIVFLTVTVSEIAVNLLNLRSFLLNAMVTALFSMVLTLPLLFVEVILPAVRLIAQETAAAAEQRFHATLQAVRDGVSLSDVTGKIVFANRAVEQLRGFAPGTLVGRHIQSIAPPEIVELENADIAAFLAGEPTCFLNQGPREITGKNGKGDPLPLEISWNSLPATGGHGAPLFVAVSRDITARKNTEAALRESEALFRTLADTAPAMIWMADAAGTLNFLNKGWLDFRGRRLEQEL